MCVVRVVRLAIMPVAGESLQLTNLVNHFMVMYLVPLYKNPRYFIIILIAAFCNFFPKMLVPVLLAVKGICATVLPTLRCVMLSIS